ncbi:hypothetical protein C5167_028601 [Papaver somniferum]|uniref:uncharacterized protein LOC113338838 n=1 Tax=Papaver somniferum TaxID=3469 RepID=UPI000E6F9119|nr:uncharacterized protein LOC113338838 [Papaver somniferum]RZC90777.1 hypothetical protein C5167_028601 [Papaver somniferum]
MGAATCLQLLHTLVPQIHCYSSSSKRGISHNDRVLVHRFDRSSLFGSNSTNLLQFQSSKPKGRNLNIFKSACSANFNQFSSEEEDFSDEEFSKQILELAKKFQLSGGDDDSSETNNNNINQSVEDSATEIISDSRFKKFEFSNEFSFLNEKINSRIPFPEQPEWAGNLDIIPAVIERKANSVDLPISLRIIKRKNQWEEGFKEAGEVASCSVKKAFSSMVFIIREIQSYTLQMREVLFYENVQGILSRVQKEMNASFVWLFQQVFSHTPTLMVSVMILLANFTVYSMSNNTAIASPMIPQVMTTESVQVTENYQTTHRKPTFDSSSIKTFSVSPIGGNNNGNGNGNGKIKLIASGAEGGDGSLSSTSNLRRSILPDEISQEVSSVGNTKEIVMREEEVKLWNSMVEEASKTRDESLDEETMKRFVSPVKVEVEQEDFTEYFKTELLYQLALSKEPQNPLLLSNYAQFLYLVVHDHDRAEDYFNRAISVESVVPDAEILSRYANFLWLAKKDIGAAETTYLEAIAAEPSNPFYASNYAHFLWSTGADDTCYPLDSPSNSTSFGATNDA